MHFVKTSNIFIPEPVLLGLFLFEIMNGFLLDMIYDRILWYSLIYVADPYEIITYKY